MQGLLHASQILLSELCPQPWICFYNTGVEPRAQCMLDKQSAAASSAQSFQILV